MLDPRLYRAALAGVVLAVIVCAFSLSAQPAPVRTTLAPDAFTGARAAQELDDLAARFPRRRPGDTQDELLARRIADSFRSISDGFDVRIRAPARRDGRRRSRPGHGDRPPGGRARRPARRRSPPRRAGRRRPRRALGHRDDARARAGGLGPSAARHHLRLDQRRLGRRGRRTRPGRAPGGPDGRRARAGRRRQRAARPPTGHRLVQRGRVRAAAPAPHGRAGGPRGGRRQSRRARGDDAMGAPGVPLHRRRARPAPRQRPAGRPAVGQRGARAARRRRGRARAAARLRPRGAALDPRAGRGEEPADGARARDRHVARQGAPGLGRPAAGRRAARPARARGGGRVRPRAPPAAPGPALAGVARGDGAAVRCRARHSPGRWASRG